MRRHSHAFTLVELLVVVAIIALLLGILLPALGRARSISQDVACLSNLRQIGLGLTTYDMEFKQLPAGFVSGYTDWGVLVNAYLSGSGKADNYLDDGTDGRHPAMQCPSALLDAGRLHYGAHAMMMPPYTSEANWRIGRAQFTLKPYSLRNLSRTSEMVVVADGGQYTDPNGTSPLYGDSYANLTNLDNGQAQYPTHWYDGSDPDMTKAIDPGANVDGTQPTGPNGVADLRWRHGSGGRESGSDGGSVGVLYADGHTAAADRDELTRANVRPDKP